MRWRKRLSFCAMRAVLAAGIHEGEALLDCCAAPGGKSAYAAALANGALDILAWDIHPHRTDMMRKNFERLGVDARVEEHDARSFAPTLEKRFDVVLVDTPCSAMGLMAHSPDIRYTRKPEDITALARLQSELLEVCAAYVKPGGVLMYCTCTLLERENGAVVDDFLSRHSEFYAEGFTLPGPAGTVESGKLTLWPHIHGTDGFFMAKLRRKL
ncbi:MAG: methyltransferase domain-containing protein [Clostridia bacterium]|nr:methyltransferase domain-containing protein [Clostridia bacterium]